jgi:lipopolysaccharide/colanic/teichoic acid biosynthesis glycosyltransferase
MPVGSEERGVEYQPFTAGGSFGHLASRRIERAFDLCILILLLPLLVIPTLLIAAAVFLDSPGDVIYRTRRVGAGRKPFWMLKFRTMRHGIGGNSLTGAGDERITPLGRFLRKSRLDELPQLWNVLRGEMRLVGPRPELEEFVDMHPGTYKEILSVPPGIAGRTQLEFALVETALLKQGEGNGRYYAEELMPRKVALDLDYVRTRSMMGDLRILGLTLLLPVRAVAAPLAAAWRGQTPWTRASLVLMCAAASALLVAFLGASGPAR